MHATGFEPANLSDRVLNPAALNHLHTRARYSLYGTVGRFCLCIWSSLQAV